MPFAEPELPECVGVRRTWKRETAWAMLLFLAVLFVWGIGWDEPAATHAAEFLTTFFMIFAGGAFGIEAIGQFKQVSR